ncbi:hypothetical protein LPTSP4_00150 [Leptospira ryugenii]|uniref:Lactonase, 7-bladed beta-propeller domain protein n=1 Tax=Leptospira ryugenii TaxID=1917863 RepID=A0A2P2DV50_9LEPT|nr:hypothetical protein LPTSP4_00150 [Leptospira ryugenii]
MSCDFSNRNSPTYFISGTINGLLATGLVLQNNGGDDLRINYGANSFLFPTRTSLYNVTVKTQAKDFSCTVANGSGRALSDITNVTVSCQPKQAGYVIVSNVTSTNISVYSVNPNTGSLTEISGSPFTNALCAARGLAISPDSSYVYAACQGEDKIRVYSITKSSGMLVEIAGSPFNVPSGIPTRLSVDPTGKWLVLGTNNPSALIHMYAISANTGALTFLGSYATSAAQPYAVTFDATGKFVYAGIGLNGNVDGWTLNTTTGALSSVGSPAPGGSNAIDITTDPAGRYLFAANYSGPGRIFVYTINPTTGVLAQISGLGPGFSTINDSPDSIFVDPKSRFVYSGNQTPANLAGFTLDISTGTLTTMAGSTFSGYSGALAMDPSGTYLYSGTGGFVRAFTVNPTTGVPSLVGTFAAGTDQTSIVIASY